jgi:HEAT repeat protein
MAVRALGERRGDAAAEAALRAIYQDEKQGAPLRRLAARALRETGDPGAAAFLSEVH